jgi:hypothetical protein
VGAESEEGMKRFPAPPQTPEDDEPAEVPSDVADYLRSAIIAVRHLIDGREGLERVTARAILVYAGYVLVKNDECAFCSLRDGLEAAGRSIREHGEHKGKLQ